MKKVNIIKEEVLDLNFYAVRSKDGKWLKAKKAYNSYGSSGGGDSWTDDIAKAKIYSKPGPAKSQITFWATNYPTYGVPDLVMITTGKCVFLDQAERVAKAVVDKARAAKKKEISRLEGLIKYYTDQKKNQGDNLKKWEDQLTAAKEKYAKEYE